MKITIEDVPNLRCAQYTERITLPVTPEVKAKLDSLRKAKKDTAELLRMLIDQFLESVEFEDAS